MLCKNCINSNSEIPEELKGVYEELAKFYGIVLYCSKRSGLVVGNEGIPSQEITECSEYEEK